jgi:hypothetical protein
MATSTPGGNSSNPVRNYRNVPHYEIQIISRSPELEFIASTVESTLCRLGFSDPDVNFMDKDAAGLLELFFDQYHFKDEELAFADATQEKDHALLSQVVEEDLSDIPKEDLVRVMASIHRAIQRRTKGGDEYLRFINEYAGD